MKMRQLHPEVLNIIKGNATSYEAATTPPSQTQLNQALVPSSEQTICIIYQKRKITWSLQMSSHTRPLMQEVQRAATLATAGVGLIRWLLAAWFCALPPGY